MTTVVRPRPVDQPVVRLVVFHHAGASASAYFPLVHGLPTDWDLLLPDLPGRGKRHSSPPLRDMSSIVSVVTDDVLAGAQAPIALFGHSLGAVVAVEVAHQLRSHGVRPLWVGVSGRVAPRTRGAAQRGEAEVSDQELLRRLRDLGGLPDRLDEVPEFEGRLLHLVRADLHAVSSHRPDPGREPLTVPLTAFGSTEDECAPPAGLGDWAWETNAGFRTRLFPGGHFHFFGAAFPGFAGVLADEIRPYLRVTKPSGQPR